MSGFRVREATTADLETVLAVQGACPGAPRWSERIWSDLLLGEASGRCAFVAEDGTGVVGFSVASFVAELAELESVAVKMDSRRRGVGRALCEAAMAWGRARGSTELELEVRASSAGALGLYRALGFVERGRRKDYYRKPLEDAVLLRADLRSEPT